MRKVEWANTDSRIEITIDGQEVTVHVVYERDTNLTDEATVTLNVDQFNQLMYQTYRVALDERKKGHIVA